MGTPWGPHGDFVKLSGTLKDLIFGMSGNPESKTSFLDVIWGFEYFSRQRAPAGHFPLPPHHFVFEIGLLNSTFVAKIHLVRMFRGRHFQ